LLYGVLLSLAAYAVFLQMTAAKVLGGWCREDGVVENLTALLYFISSVTFLLSATRYGSRSVWYWTLALLFLLVAGEEISWGQRLFDLSTPQALVVKNTQTELNVHNIGWIQPHVRGIGLLMFSGICFLIPLTDRFSSFLRMWYRRLNIPVYPLWAAGVTAVGILFMAIPRLLFHRIIPNMDEIGELYLPVGFLIFAYSEFKRSRAYQAERA
jgi:hypothetical protein